MLPAYEEGWNEQEPNGDALQGRNYQQEERGRRERDRSKSPGRKKRKHRSRSRERKRSRSKEGKRRRSRSRDRDRDRDRENREGKDTRKRSRSRSREHKDRRSRYYLVVPHICINRSVPLSATRVLTRMIQSMIGKLKGSMTIRTTKAGGDGLLSVCVEDIRLWLLLFPTVYLPSPSPFPLSPSPLSPLTPSLVGPQSAGILHPEDLNTSLHSSTRPCKVLAELQPYTHLLSSKSRWTGSDYWNSSPFPWGGYGCPAHPPSSPACC